MSLGTMLAADCSRPASFLPSIKCSQCSQDIDIAAMGDHICGPSPDGMSHQYHQHLQQPPSQQYLYQQQPTPPQEPHQPPAQQTKPRSFSNPFALRQYNASGQRPVQPSPLSQSQAPSDPTVRMPPTATLPLPPPRTSRTAPPRINPDAANRSFLGQAAHPQSPRSPRANGPFGGSGGGKPGAPPRSATGPMPRLRDLRPPSEELSANLDCAFPPFPTPFTSTSRPGSRSGSERGSSRSGSRQDTRDLEPRSPIGNGGDLVVNRMHTMTKGPFNNSQRRPSNESKFSQEPPLFLDRRRPSLPKTSTIPPQPATRSRSSSASSNYSESALRPLSTRPSSPRPFISDADIPPLPWHAEEEQKLPPQRPARPTESILSPQFLDQLSAEPDMALPPALAISSPPIPQKSARRQQSQDDEDTFKSTSPLELVKPTSPLELTKVSSEPAFGNPRERPPFLAGLHSEPSQIPQVRPISRSSNGSDDHGQNQHHHQQPVVHNVGFTAQPVHQINRMKSLHAPSESGSSTASDHSAGNSNSSHDNSSSAASSIDAFSPLSYSAARFVDDEETKESASSDEKPDVAPVPLLEPDQAASKPIPKFEEPLPSPPNMDPRSTNWPLESPMDPALENRRIVPEREQQWQGAQRPNVATTMPPPPAPLASTPDPASSSTPVSPANDHNAVPSLPPMPSGPMSPPGRGRPPLPGQRMPPPGQMRSRSRTGTNTRPPMSPMPGPPRSQTPQSMRPPPVRQQTAPMPRPQDPYARAQSPGNRMRSPSAGPGMRPPMPPMQGHGPRMPPPRGMPRPPPPQQQQRQQPPRQQQQQVGRLPAAGGPQLTPDDGSGGIRSSHIPPRSQSLSRKTTGPNGKPLCRGCNIEIEGKSVKAADGRLTGRWHKACFVCRSCRAPFTTADFYVIANQPYCEQHYHEKNGSLCRGCNRGIEGPYLETLGSPGLPPNAGGGQTKYHPKCFTCVECRAVLSDDYFEIGGRVYCERHAMASARGQARAASGSVSSGTSASGGALSPSSGLPPSSLRAERRTTRLMMM